MYWPASAPRIFAAQIAQGRVDGSDADSDQSTDTVRLYGTSNTPLRSHSRHASISAAQSTSEPSTPVSPRIAPVEHDAQDYFPSESAGQDAEARPIDGVSQAQGEEILDLRMSRNASLFATITATSMSVWQTRPMVILATVIRSETSLETYGANVALLIRPDSAIFVVQTRLGYLITYSLASHSDARVYRPHFSEDSSVSVRRQSNFTGVRNLEDRIPWGPGEEGGMREVSVRFRMAIKVDAGIINALALDDELIVATQKPAAIQCIRWTPDEAGNQTRTELLRKIDWFPRQDSILTIVHDRPMNLSAWISSSGQAFAVQRTKETQRSSMVQESATLEGSPLTSTSSTPPNTPKLFRGYCFHKPESSKDSALVATINARFSLIAIGVADGGIHVYNAKDYNGNIPLSHKQEGVVSKSVSGDLQFLSYSPDGYCLFAGYQNGWATWSVFGKPGGTSFVADRKISTANAEAWLTGVKHGIWLGGGTEILLVGNDDRLWSLEMARSAAATCFTAANISRTVLQTSSGLMIYRGHDMPDMTSNSAEASLWHKLQIPSSYIIDQWPIRCTVISSDGRYIAVAGRYGLAHCSIASGRWKQFVDKNMENEFQVRGGMCWYGHLLIAAIDASDSHEIRMYSRETALDSSLVLHTVKLASQVVLISPSGQDSILVYTQDNSLTHYIIDTTAKGARLFKIGQIAFHGIVRSPARVRGVSWILPDEQLAEGDPAQDVTLAAVLFLVDGNLVLLQPSVSAEKKFKYDMRVVAQNIEYFILARDLPMEDISPLPDTNAPDEPGLENLSDSIWMFDGDEIKVWPDVLGMLRPRPKEMSSARPPIVAVEVDFYPLSILLKKGIILGIDADLVQRRDFGFSFFRLAIRTHLFIPHILRHYLTVHSTPAALRVAEHFKALPYFAHALEVLLHVVLDQEVETSPPVSDALLPVVLAFLSAFPQYLEIVVQCTRKTEVRSWRTLFQHLPPAADLFEEALAKGSLKTAGGYLLVLHTFEDPSQSSEQSVRLLDRARAANDWELCKELARFLVALDGSGATLRRALESVGLARPQPASEPGSLLDEQRLRVPRLKSPGGKLRAKDVDADDQAGDRLDEAQDA